jgi:hypothetical protein
MVHSGDLWISFNHSFHVGNGLGEGVVVIERQIRNGVGARAGGQEEQR